MKQEKGVLKLRGEIVDTLPGSNFKVAIKLEDKTHELIGYISGKMRMYYIKLQKGDQVEVEVSPTDLNKGRITYRLNKR
ncbi:MAG: translation initiation factor IF-1 [Candidatus Dojkabacteria bacterium]